MKEQPYNAERDQTTDNLRRCARALLILLLSGLACTGANAGVAVMGVQYQSDQHFPEFDCYWNASAYPGPCRTPVLGATVHVYLKNTGASAVTMTDATLAGYSLKTIIKTLTATYNPDGQSSIYFYWDDPPQDVIDAGEPVWYRFDPPIIPAGGVGQVAVRLRYVPKTPTIEVEVLTSGGVVTTNIAVDANVPRVSSIGYSEDLRNIYVHWSRAGGSGAAPISVWLDGTDVTSLTTTVGDPTMNFAASVIALPNALPFFSYHVFQGVYGDGKIAAASQRAWTNKFIYTTYDTFDYADSAPAAWVEEASDHGFNNVQMNLGGMGSYMGTTTGRTNCLAHGYGYTIRDKTKLNLLDPDMFFLNDEPDGEENNQCNTHCGSGLRIPCDSEHYGGTLVMKTVAYGESELRSLRPNVPFTVNLDGALAPESFFSWGPAMDILQTDNYYEVPLRRSYLEYPNRIPLYSKALLSYAAARTACAAAEPNPTSHLLYCNKDNVTGWPYPTPESKRFEVYYSLAGGSKGIGYWWLNSPNGLYDTSIPARAALWKEIGLCGNEIKTARDLIVRSVPVDLPLVPSSKVWARAAASGIDTFILYVVNDNYYNDINGCHYTPVNNATVTVTLPSWMQSALSTFEITPGGIRPVSRQVNGNQLQLNLGTLKLTRMIVVTKSPRVRAMIQRRYDAEVRPSICNMAPEYCVHYPPPPVLHVERHGNDEVAFSWPTNSDGYTLMSSPDSSDADSLSPVSQTPQVVGGMNVVTNAISGEHNFYRLMLW